MRRIHMIIEGWDAVPDTEQEAVFGRRKAGGEPLSGGTITTPLDLSKRNPDGSLAISETAHVRLAAAASANGAQILRRSFAYVEPSSTGPQAGQIFLAFQSDPRTAFVPIQQNLSQSDALNQHTQHIGSAVFACPPGVQAGQRWSRHLFAG
jgi:deferrochelatase/peroxidase EfeB